MGQNGTLDPSSCDTAKARAVFPVPGAPTSRSARPENLRDLMRSTTTPHAYSCYITFQMYSEGEPYLSGIRLPDETCTIHRR